MLFGTCTLQIELSQLFGWAASHYKSSRPSALPAWWYASTLQIELTLWLVQVSDRRRTQTEGAIFSSVSGPKRKDNSTPPSSPWPWCDEPVPRAEWRSITPMSGASSLCFSALSPSDWLALLPGRAGCQPSPSSCLPSVADPGFCLRLSCQSGIITAPFSLPYQHTHTCTHTHAHTHTHTHTHTHVRTHARTHIRAHTHTRARMHARTHAHTHTLSLRPLSPPPSR